LLQIKTKYGIILLGICKSEVTQVNAVEIILGILVILVSLIIIFAVLFQQGRRAGINGAISGGADTFLSKNKARTADALLARWTKYVAILFFVLAIVANIIALRG
jgi:preprotein translocase subunit SecG